ncbi:subtilisin-like protein [Whalleya microplaca]|nr:subtilisin-like protein [Whalleya microplaca]
MMRVSASLLALLSASTVAWAAQAPEQVKFNKTEAPEVAAPRRYIVELKSTDHSARVAAKIAAHSGLRLFQEFKSDLFPAVSVECDGDCDAESLRAILDQHDDGDDDQGTVVASMYKSTLVQILPTIKGESFSDDATAKNYSVHASTGVEKLHEAGIIGKGAIVAIVDSGIQYTHPALGGGIGPNYTVIGGYDLVGDEWPDKPANPDNDPMDHYGHGTHTAGIVAGKSDQFVGVAPGAKLLSFKVFGTSGYSNEETVIEGFLKAFESGADIISASVGERSGFTTNAWAVLASRMVDRGVFISIAAGNDGQDGPFDMSNGASGVNVLTVGASEPGEFPAQGFTADFNLDGVSNKTEVAYIPGAGFFPNTVLNWPFRPLTLNASVEGDACKPLPANTTSLKGSIILVRAGGCTIHEKHTNVAAFGPEYILFYSDDGPYVAPSSGNKTGLIGMIEAAAGEAIVKTILAGGNVTASFDVDTGHYVGLYNAGSGRPALYSSWGSTYDLALKPDVSAPGSKILSTYPTDKYQVLSGTSMATPYMAGVAALWVGKFGGRAAHAADPAWAKKLLARITGTARAVPWADWATSSTDYGFWAPTTQVGAGYVDAERVLSYTTELGFDGRKIELNDTVHFTGTHSVDITNLGSEAVTYTFALQDAGGYESWNPAIPGQPQTFVPSLRMYSDLTPVNMTPEVKLPEGQFIVGPGETKAAEFTFTIPEGLNENKIPVYSGKVLISGSNGEELGVPYFGIGSDLNKTVTSSWYYGGGYPFIVSGPNQLLLDKKANFTFNLTLASQDFPKLNTMFVWGTKEFRWDVFDASYTEADWSYPPVIGKNHFVGSATTLNRTTSSGRFDPSQDSEDAILPFPLYNQPRGLWSIYNWLGRFANGTNVVPGEYKFRIALLRPFGDPEVAYDWDIWQTPNITVLPK